MPGLGDAPSQPAWQAFRDGSRLPQTQDGIPLHQSTTLTPRGHQRPFIYDLLEGGTIPGQSLTSSRSSFAAGGRPLTKSGQTGQ